MLTIFGGEIFKTFGTVNLKRDSSICVKQMSNMSGISAAHVRKLSHNIEEIRLRALDNIISKYNLGFGCDCDAVKKELITKLFNWFSFEAFSETQKVLDLLLRLLKTDDRSHLNTFGKLRLQNELQELRRKLGSEWYEKLNEIEEAVLCSDKLQTISSNSKTIKDPSCPTLGFIDYDRHRTRIKDYEYNGNNKIHRKEDHNLSQNGLTTTSALNSTVPFDLTLECGDGTPISKATEGGIKWLIMPWQPLVTSDRGVLAAVEEALNNSLDANLILHTCQFITNVMMQDFPAEVFLQRPAIVFILHNLLESSANITNANFRNIIPMVLKTLHKLTRSLRLRIYYYCEPCIANKKQKLLAEKLSNNVYSPSETRDSPDGGFPEVNYQAYQSTGTSERSQSVSDNIDDSILQLQQMLIPIFCIETLKRVISQLSISTNSTLILRSTKYVTDVIYELVQVLVISVMPNVWLCNDDIALKVIEDMKVLFGMLGEVIEYFGNYSTIDDFRITYLHLISITMKLLSHIVPLEIADVIFPKSLKTSICVAIMDAAIYFLYPKLHSILQEYGRQFQGSDEIIYIKTFDETRMITKSIQATIYIIKNTPNSSHSEVLKMLYASKLSLPYHKNFGIIKKTIEFLQNMNRYSPSNEDQTLATKLILSLLANADTDIQYATYFECHTLVKSILGVEYNKEKLSWENLAFLFELSVLIEIISYGVTHDDKRIKEMSEEILVYILKGRLQMGENGWLKSLEAIVQVLPFLQCHAYPSSTLGQCVTKIFDPDVSTNIQLPYIEVLKGNLRFLFSSDEDIRYEAVCRLIWLLGKEKDSVKKLPRLSSLHDLPLSSLCIFDRQRVFKRSEGSYQRSNLLSVLEMLNEPNVDPKIRKSALVQISVMLTDSSLHKLFITENGLSLILNIFNSALVEKEYVNYPDSVIPIITILKLLASSECSIRQDLSIRINVLSNITRSLFLFPNNECIKTDGSQLLCLLLYNEYIMRLSEKYTENYNQLNISLPYIIVSKMKLPFLCKSHWKISRHRRSDMSVLHGNDSLVLTFIRQYWIWEWNGGINVLWKHFNDLHDSNISKKLKILENEFLVLRLSFPHYSCQQQLYNIQNSTTHDSVSCALDYLTMHIKLYKMEKCEEIKDISLLPWEQTFERFLLSQPASKEDCDLFVEVLNFLQFYINITKDGKYKWTNKIMTNITKSLTELLKSSELDNQNVHQSILKLAGTCSAIGQSERSTLEDQDVWLHFIELIVSTLCLGDQQHFYNLAYLDWLLTCLTYLIGKCHWTNCKNLLISLGNTLIELIISFHGAGTISFMGLSITRNSIICLNHLLYQMQINFNKNIFVQFWYEEDRMLNWLPMLWQNRDPLVRASALQLLAGLMSNLHTASQLLNSIALAPSELCQALLQCIISREESCIVREQACCALSSLIKNCNSIIFQYMDSLKANAILIYIEQNNIYYEISVLCSNIYMSTSLDCDHMNNQEQETGKVPSIHSMQSGCTSLVPRAISHLYNCHDELQPLSVKESTTTEMDHYLQLVATPSLISAVCRLLNNLILIGKQEVVHQIYEHSIDKYLIGCINEIPKDVESKRNLTHYCDILEMYISICRVLTNCITNSNEYSLVASFSVDSLYMLFCFLNDDLYCNNTSQLISVRNKLWTEIFNFIAILSLTENQHFETIQNALELRGPEAVLSSICVAMKDSNPELRISAIGCLAFLLSQEIEKDSSGKSSISLQSIMDTPLTRLSNDNKNNLKEITSDVNTFSLQSTNMHSTKSNGNKDPPLISEKPADYEVEGNEIAMSKELCNILLHLFIAHNYNRSKKNKKLNEDKDLIISALTNLLCVSNTAKQVALEENLPDTTLMILKESYVRLNLQPFELFKNQIDREKKIHPLLRDMNAILVLLMNFMYGSTEVKVALTKAGLADVLHKLWAWIALNKTVSTTALKLLATYTTKCTTAQSLTLTTILPGTGLRKTPNTLALIHVIIQLVCKEIDKAGQLFDNHKLHFAFHVLRNAIHVHECRVSISKSNLLQFFTKIHPITTKRTKPWPLVELYCLEFLIDFTYYEEGQICVPKAVDGLDVLLQLSKYSSSSNRILAISILRNLAFNMTNRPRLLSSVDFINVLHDIFKNGSLVEIRIAGSMLWSLISNNQKGKLIVRSAGFSQSIQEALGRITLLNVDDKKEEEDLLKMLQYILKILSPVDTKAD
ncbi:rotatin isoform X2 [Bombus impatiens]|uniref:Rotatin isoform X2 n=1 Tax=Bombus impatiens TaxID=132113 RepID=A0A6P6F862_BOMIM|nr:rotatin isoform X2 [Bombus impatiens]